MSLNSWKNRKIRIFTLFIDNVSFDQAKKILIKFLEEEALHRVYTPNTEIAMESKNSPDLSQLINGGDLVVADGIGLVLGSKLRKHPLKERVTGFDLSMFLLDYAEENNLGVYLLGGKEGVANEARDKLAAQRPNLTIAGAHNGYFKGAHLGAYDHEEEKEVIESIVRSKAQILFVGLGFPKQEIWIEKNKNRLGPIRLAIGNGGVIDILAGKARRAPDIFIRLHLEWFYRLLKEPKRITRQKLLPLFLAKILWDKNSVEEVQKAIDVNKEEE